MLELLLAPHSFDVSSDRTKGALTKYPQLQGLNWALRRNTPGQLRESPSPNCPPSAAITSSTDERNIRLRPAEGLRGPALAGRQFIDGVRQHVPLHRHPNPKPLRPIAPGPRTCNACGTGWNELQR